MRKSSILILGMSLAFFAMPAMAENVTVTAQLDRRQAEVEEDIHLTIQVTGASGNVQAPRLQSIPNVDTYYTGRASHLSFINGVQTAKVEFNYTLIPQAAGSFTIPPIELTVSGQSYKTPAMTVAVTGSPKAVAPRQPASLPPTSGSGSAPATAPVTSAQMNLKEVDDPNIFVKATVDKDSVYPNEQILLTYSLYTRYDTRYEGFSEEPELSGFWIEEFPMGRDVQRETVRINGKNYIKADIRKIALFPTEAAQYTIQPGKIKASIRQEPQAHSVFDEFFNDSFFSGSGFFSRREDRALKTQPIPVEVKPFPAAGQPGNFTGAVGNFRITATIDHESVKQNEPITMKIVIEGEGNIETLKKPQLPDLKNFKVYESDTTSELFKTGNIIGGRKNIEIVFIPTQAGDWFIPRLTFAYFNPVLRQYQTLQTPEFQIHAEPSDKTFSMPRSLSQSELFKKEIEREGEDIRFIEERFPRRSSDERLAGVLRILTALNGILVLLWFLAVLRAQREKLFSRDQALKRRRLARSQAEARIKKLRALGGASKPESALAYFEEIDKVLTQFLSDKFGLSTLGTTRMDIEMELQKTLGTADPLYQSILEVYRICDESRFGKQELPPQIRQDAMKILRQTIERVDKVRK
ncbi:MAG: BatD family protein [Candidatus Omnitrophota bacterium]